MVTIINQSEMEKKKDNKFSLPTVNKYICCFCMPLKSAISLSAVLIAVFYFVRVVTSLNNLIQFNTMLYLSFIIYIINIIALLLFLFGVVKGKVAPMRLLKYTLIFSILINIYNLVKKTKSVFSGDAFKNIKLYEDEINTEEDKAELMNTQKYIIILEIFINIYIIYFYYAIWSYIYVMEEEEREEQERRKIEENVQ